MYHGVTYLWALSFDVLNFTHEMVEITTFFLNSIIVFYRPTHSCNKTCKTSQPSPPPLVIVSNNLYTKMCSIMHQQNHCLSSDLHSLSMGVCNVCAFLLLKVIFCLFGNSDFQSQNELDWNKNLKIYATLADNRECQIFQWNLQDTCMCR